MSAPVLVVPTITLGGTSAAVVLPATETYSMLAGDTGFYYANNGAIVVRYVCGAGGSGNLTVLFSQTVEGQAVTSFTIAVTAASTYLIGPYSPSRHNNVSGQVQINRSTAVTTDSVGLYFVPGWVT